MVRSWRPTLGAATTLMQRTSASMAPHQLRAAPLLYLYHPVRWCSGLKTCSGCSLARPLRALRSVRGWLRPLHESTLTGGHHDGPDYFYPHPLIVATPPGQERCTNHPDAVSEASLNLPRRIDDPTSAAQLTRDLLRNHREDITMALSWTTDSASSVRPSSPLAGYKRLACPLARSSLGRKRASPAPASSSATAATVLRAPPKARTAPSVPSPQRAAGTALSWPIT